MDRKVAMSTIRGMRVIDSIDVAAMSGCDGIEIQTDYLPEDTKTYDTIFAYAKQRGLEVSLHAPCGDINISALNRGISKESVAQVKAAIDLAEMYSARCVTFHPGRLSSARENVEDKWKVMMESAAEIAEYAEEKKVHTGIENMELRKKELVFSESDLNRFAELGKYNPYFGVTLDLCHFATNGILSPNLEEIKLPVKNVHMSQCVDGKPHFPLDSQDGQMDIEHLANLIEESGYRGPMVLELKSITDWKVFAKSRKILSEV